jgi:cobalamin-dependent methionine synthase I
MEPLVCTPDLNFVNIGERCNVAGSRVFARCITSGQYEKAVQIAREQVRTIPFAVHFFMDYFLTFSFRLTVERK